ncbi:MAG: HD domain-containing protein [Bacilli bacterium]|nr:HD domain-containing protein [Bacilli bacterium]
MKMNSYEALEMLNNARGKTSHDGWIDHSICVGNAAGEIAEALNKINYNLDIDKIKTLGYIHDIGKMVGEFKNHVMNGYEFLKNKGYDEEYCNICLTHSYLNNDINCTAGGIPSDIPFRTEFIKKHQYTLEEKIINLCDLMCTSTVNTIDKRLIDILIRRGAYSNTQYHVKETYKLKEYFDNLLGYNLYDLFPEIKDNL